MRVLAGDIGGTHTRLTIVEYRDDHRRTLRTGRVVSRDFADLTTLVRSFLGADDPARLAATCLAIAGPVQRLPTGQRVQVTNLPWVIDSQKLALDCRLARVRLINDFEAVGHGVGVLEPAAFEVLQAGVPDEHGTRAVLGAGTGLGQAIVVPTPDGERVLATEGGHVDFGPTNETELELARWLIAARGRACYEDILSGPGLKRLYDFLNWRGVAPESPALAQTLLSGDPAAAIGQAALAGNDSLAVAALDLFVRIYGAQAGNLALAAGATGGVYIAGGIAPRIASALRDGRLLTAFRNKGGMTRLLAAIPLRVVMDADVGLRGAQAVAARLARADRV